MQAYREWRADHSDEIFLERYPTPEAKRARKSFTHIAWLRAATKCSNDNEPELVGVYVADHIKEYSEEALTELRDWLCQYMGTGSSRWYVIRAVIQSAKKRLGYLPVALDALKPDKAFWEGMQDANSRARVHRHSNPLVIDAADVYHAVFEALESDCPLTRLCALQVCCGARKNEMIRSKFSLVENDRTLIRQHFVSKKRDKDQTPLIKPLLLLSAFDFCWHLDRTRGELESQWARKYKTSMYEDDAVANKGKFSVALGKCVAKMLPQVAEAASAADRPCNTHLLRAVYANLAYEIIKPKQTLQLFVQQGLGHCETDLSTANAYTGMKIENCVLEKMSEQLDEKCFALSERSRRFNSDSGEKRLQIFGECLQDREVAYRRLFTAVRVLSENGVNVTATRLARFGVKLEYAEEFANSCVCPEDWVGNVHQFCNQLGLIDYCWKISSPLPTLPGRACDEPAQGPLLPPAPLPSPVEAVPAEPQIGPAPDPLVFLTQQLAARRPQPSAQAAPVVVSRES
jgi:hypothetical protein